MTEKRLATPLRREDLADLRTGDTVYLSGILVTGRDDVHLRVAIRGRTSPANLSGGAIFHAGPITRRTPEPAPGEWELIAVGPTTSMRMESCQGAFLEKTGARLIVGKGGMGPATAEACRRLGAVHTVFPGGCAVLAAAAVEAVEGVHWLDLGMPEAMWVLRVRDFGPLIVSIDTLGNNLFEDNKRRFEERKEAAMETLRPHLRFME
ncbi:MAG: L(+)-tartrate dehydratase subunit beta [Treponema sp.]|jgi:L(+)-tartrate dehydratase beta subunit|nr:L(+)-tartrate dehydratase subunit beta [Treponema sp.]